MPDTEETQQKSKSQIKREMLALQDLGRDLVKLPDKALHQIPISAVIEAAIRGARQLKMEARRRQLKHIGKLMRSEDVEAIRIALASLRQPHGKKVSEFHEVESWRDALLAGDDAMLNGLCQRFSNIDRQHLRQLVRNAKKEELLSKAPRSARVLFRYLKEFSHRENE